MTNLLRTEWLKIKKYWAFWLMIGLTALSYPGLNYIFHKIFVDITRQTNSAGRIVNAIFGNPFTFPEIWRTAAYASSVFVFIPAIVIIMLITNEYNYKTSRQNIIDGWSRNNFMTSKLLDVIIITFIITFLYAAVALSIGFANTPKIDSHSWSLAYYTALFALQTFAQLSLAFLVGFLVRRAFLALGIFVFYFFIAEPIGVGLLKKYANDIGRFLPLEISDRTIPPPSFFGRFDEKGYQRSLDAVSTHVIYTIALTAIVWLICYWINNRRDL